MHAAIINRGRGPEIEGTRITVYDIMDHLQADWPPTRIAAFLRVSTDQVQAALDYIESHKQDVTAAYQRMLDRAARGNPPEIIEKQRVSHNRLQAELARRQQLKEQGAADAHDNGRQ